MMPFTIKQSKAKQTKKHSPVITKQMLENYNIKHACHFKIKQSKVKQNKMPTNLWANKQTYTTPYID